MDGGKAAICVGKTTVLELVPTVVMVRDRRRCAGRGIEELNQGVGDCEQWWS